MKVNDSVVTNLQSYSELQGRWFRAQCAPASFNLNQKVHGLYHLYKAVTYKTIQNQLKKPSVIGLPKFTIVKLAGKCHKHTSFTIENLFFEDYCFGSPMTDGFSTDSDLSYPVI